MDIDSKYFQPLIKQLGKKYGYRDYEIKAMIRSQFQCMREVMKKVDSYNEFWPYIRLPYLFLCTVKEGKRKYFRKKNAKILEDVYTGQGQQDTSGSKTTLDPGI
jgi:hypothetical protein